MTKRFNWLKACKFEKDNLEIQLNSLNNRKIVAVSRNLEPINKIPSEVWSFLVDTKGNLYIGNRTDNWTGGVYRCLAGEKEFRLMSGLNGEVWALVVDEDKNIYAGIRTGENTGNVYKCLAGTEIFLPMKGIKECVADLDFDSQGNMYAHCWTGYDVWQITGKYTYKCLKGETEFSLVNS